MAGKEETNNRDQQILRRLANIEHKIDSLDQTNVFVLKADLEPHKQTVRNIFKKGLRRAQVYLASNGKRSVQDIADLLNMKIPNVSIELTILTREGLLEIFEKDGGKVIYGKKLIDRTIGISKLLMKDYGLNRDGEKAEG